MKKVSILGSTGSIGTQALEIIDLFPDKFKVLGLSAGRNIHLLKEQIEKYKPHIAAVESEEYARKLKKVLNDSFTEIVFGEEGYNEVSSYPEVDTVISSIVGSAGLVPTFAAIKSGKNICLANKESLVVAGELLIKEASASNSSIIPIDSEHSAIFQALNGSNKNDVKRLILTASGGPFRETPKEKLNQVTVENALNHPTWKMGRKITIDSSTLMNKGFEVIEA
ncbi:MAG: 1-deoxy-D-xylulose-5-phosphate reductoisomerase, partial [Thermodesulfobacteriota bacterium]